MTLQASPANPYVVQIKDKNIIYDNESTFYIDKGPYKDILENLQRIMIIIWKK